MSAVCGGRTDSPESSDRVSSCSGPPSRRSPAGCCFRPIRARERSMKWLASLRAGRRSPSLDSSNTVPEFLQPPAIRRLASCESASCVHASGAPTSFPRAHQYRPFLPFWPRTSSTLFPAEQVLEGIIRWQHDRFQWRQGTGEKTAFSGRSTQRQHRRTTWTIRKISFLIAQGRSLGPREGTSSASRAWRRGLAYPATRTMIGAIRSGGASSVDAGSVAVCIVVRL